MFHSPSIQGVLEKLGLQLEQPTKTKPPKKRCLTTTFIQGHILGFNTEPEAQGLRLDTDISCTPEFKVSKKD